MAKFDEQLSRMEYLMGYHVPVNESHTSSNIEYSTKGADGKVYGILKEGNRYYIKTTEDGKQNISESYKYINGFNSRKENEYKSYNEATKQLEMKMIVLNEAYGVHSDVSTVDFTRGEKMLSNLTEEARKELNRVNMIIENSNAIGIKSNIGDHGNPEGKGNSTGADTVKNNKPFDEKATASLDKDSVAQHSDPKNTDYNYQNAEKGVEADLESVKMKKGGKSQNDYTDAHDDLDGEGVADKKPKGGKAVMVNEGLFNPEDVIETPMDQADLDEPYEDDEFEELPVDEPDFGEEDADAVPAEAEVGNDIVGADDEEYDKDLDALMEEFEGVISGDEEELTGPHGSLPTQVWDKMEESCDCGGDGCEEAMKGRHAGNEALTWDKMNESQKKVVNVIVEGVCEKIFNTNKKSAIKEAKKSKTAEQMLQGSIDRIVKEEVTKLNAWGKHPKYGKEPMTTPENPNGDGKMVGTASKDWNDASAKGSQRYGQKIGNSAPFDKVVDVLTDSVMKMLKEQMGLKKK